VNRLFLKIVPKAKIAQHLKKRMMPRRPPHILDFDDSSSATFPDSDHLIGENRYVIIGMSSSGQLLVVSYTDREDRTRIISARTATRPEKRFYEEGS
jgi:uncharacterized protein